MHKCRVPGCSSVSQLVRFPRDENEIDKWLQLIKNPILENMSNGLLYKIERICVDHFENKCFSDESTVTNKILLPDVMPTLSLPGSKDNIKCIAHVHQNTNYPQVDAKNQVVTTKFAKRLKATILNLPALDRICVLLYKTVKLSPKLVYNSNYDMIFGWQNVNTPHKNAFAQKAIVFMVRSLYSNWKQMLSFVLYDDENEHELLIQSLKDVINTCFSFRLKIIATICEDNKFNVNAMNSFARQSHEKCLHDDGEYGYQSFTVNNHEVVVLYDVVNLLKKVQNENENDKFDENFEFFVRLFNSLDGCSKRTDTNNVRTNVTLTSEHWDFWVKNVEILQNWKKTDEPPSCVQQWTTTLFGVMHLWRGILQRSNFKSFSPRFLQLRELNKVINKIRSYKKEPIRYMDYDEASYTNYLNTMTTKIKSNKYKKKLNCNSFVKCFKNEISSFQDGSLPLCDATRPLLFEKIQQITDKDFNDYDYRNLDLGMSNNHARPLISAPEFHQFDYDPILYFENSKFDWTLTRNQICKLLPLEKIKNSVTIDMLLVLKTNNCNDCNIIGNNFTKTFFQIVTVILLQLPKYYNKPKISALLSEACHNYCVFDFDDCVEHNLMEIFINCCIRFVIKFWILRINRCLTKKCNFYSNMDVITKQAVLIGKKKKTVRAAVYKIKNRKIVLNRWIKK